MRRPRSLHGPTHGFGAALGSPPHLLVNGVLRREGAFKGRIFSPASGNIAQIALAELGLAKAESANHGLYRHFVQALALFPGRNAESGVEIVRHIANRILHTVIVGNAGNYCKRKIIAARNGQHFEEIASSLVNPWEAEKQGIGNREQGIEKPVG
jgi:hypothetical protein